MELVQYQDYEEYKKAMNTVLNRTVEDFVMTGYLLKQGRDTDILKNSGYNNVNEFAWAEYKLEATQVSRYIRINDRFSEGGYSPRLQENYKGWQISFYARKPRDPKLIALKNRLNELDYHPTIAHEYVTEDRVWHSYFSITTDGVIG